MKKITPDRLSQRAMEAAYTALERLEDVLSDPTSTHADVIKASALVFDQAHQARGEGAPSGDWEITVKEE